MNEGNLGSRSLTVILAFALGIGGLLLSGSASF